MSRSLTWLRRGLLGLACAGSLGFGATQALAGPQPESQAWVRTCPDWGYDYYYQPCAYGCPGGYGYCAAGGICRCGHIP